MPAGLTAVWLPPLLLGFVAALVVTPAVRWVAVRTRVIDLPVGMKIHTRPTPLLGGVAVYLAFGFAMLAVLPLSKPVLGLLIGGFVAVLVGVLDDVLKLSPLPHLAGHFAAALAAVLAGIGIVSTISVPFASLTAPGFHLPAVIGFVVTLLWLAGMMNAVNFLDGLDGLSTGVCAIAALLLAVWAAEPHRFYLPVPAHDKDPVLPLALAGALLGFLPFNWRPARIFLGDSGTSFLGLAIGGLAIVGPAKLGTALLVLIIPVLDVAWAIVRRQMRGRSFLSGDKQHVYHRMMELGVGYTTTVLFFYLLCAALGVLDLLALKLAKLIAFLVLAAATAGFFVFLEVRASQRAAAPADASPQLGRAPE